MANTELENEVERLRQAWVASWEVVEDAEAKARSIGDALLEAEARLRG